MGKFLLFFLDFDTFRRILSFLKDNNLSRIKAIVWNINPTNQEDDLIAKQASLINQIRPKDVWTNVIVICKRVKIDFFIIVITENVDLIIP